MERACFPGYERLQLQYPWDWRSCETTTVRAGHDSVSALERSNAKKTGAKLTFGEVLESGVILMLENLGAYQKQTFHDLGCGTGKLLIQTYLHCHNLTRCFGIELAPGRYRLAEQNLQNLVQSGWQGRQFLTVEYRESDYFKIVECMQNKILKVGMPVICFQPSLRTSKYNTPDYSAIIVSISGPIYTVQYLNTRQIAEIEENYIFPTDQVRTLEISMGNLFHHKDAWNCECCILETDFPSQTHSRLLKGMEKAPIGCTFFTYLDLKQFSCYNSNKFRQLDKNVYDSDRYPASWSQGWRFYCWEHTLDASVPIESYQIKYLHDVKFINICSDNHFEVVKLVNIDQKNGKVYVLPNGADHLEELDPHSTQIFSLGFRHDVGTKICSYWPLNMRDENPCQFELFFGQVQSVDVNGYTILFDDGEVASGVNPKWVFQRPNFLFSADQYVSACWPGNAQNKNCPERYNTFPGIITRQNADGTYRIRYFSGKRSNHIREMWLTSLSEEEYYLQKARAVLPPDTDQIESWNVQTVCRWIYLLGLSNTCVEEFCTKEINGSKLLNLKQQELLSLNLNKKEVQLLANKIYRLRK